MKQFLCNTQTVQNILAGRQLMDRRPIKPQPEYEKDGYYWWKGDWDTRGGPRAGVCTHGSAGNGEATWTLDEIAEYPPYKVGDVLYVRERIYYSLESGNFYYYADKKGVGLDVYAKLYAHFENRKKTIPSIHMPKWAARIFVTPIEVKIEKGDDGIWYWVTEFGRCDKVD